MSSWLTICQNVCHFLHFPFVSCSVWILDRGKPRLTAPTTSPYSREIQDHSKRQILRPENKSSAFVRGLWVSETTMRQKARRVNCNKGTVCWLNKDYTRTLSWARAGVRASVRVCACVRARSLTQEINAGERCPLHVLLQNHLHLRLCAPLFPLDWWPCIVLHTKSMTANQRRGPSCHQRHRH